MTPRHILVHDRNTEVTVTLRLMLEALGHRVTTAVSSADVMTLLSRKNVDVVMTNSVYCNYHSGAGLPSIIRAMQPHAAIILTTGIYNDSSFCVADAVLPKSFSMTALDATISEVAAS